MIVNTHPNNLDIGLTHIALPVANIDRSIEFYAQYAQMQIVHRRIDAKTGVAVVWLCDKTRPFAIVLIQSESEANLVDCLRSTIEILSLVAIELDGIVGHICFSPVTIAGEGDRDLTLLGLAPLAVLPDYQRQGIGSLLVRQGLAECTSRGCQAVFVLGNPAYYGRFGFTPARQTGLQCEFLVPDDAFMVLELVSGGLDGRTGTVKYAAAFDRFK